MTAQVGEAVVNHVFAGTGQSHSEVISKIKDTQNPQSFRSRKTFTISNFTEHHTNGIGYNVMGFIEGTDPTLKDEVIIIGANIDHVGFCYEIMPGANNNASGAAVMLGLAEALSQNPVKPKRSVLFLGIGSKEQALRGAHAYLKNPVFPRTKTVTFFNLNMVGCGDRIEAISAQNYPDLWEFIAEANEDPVNLPLESLPFANTARPELDAAIFLNKKIPSIIFHATGAPTYPYTTKDTPDTLTPQTMSGLAKILHRAVLEIANTKHNFFDAK
jgi:Zn-dependent M28 family amino/carboxypeptidase